MLTLFLFSRTSSTGSLTAVVKIGELGSTEAAALPPWSHQAVLALVVNKLVAVVMEPALAVVALVVHRVAEELTPFVVLANCLTVAATGNMCYMLNLVFVFIATQAGPEVANARQGSWWVVATFIQVRCWTSRLAGALVSRWSWMRHISALMVIGPEALVVGEMVALGVDVAVTPVVVTLTLPVVRPESALWVVLTDGLAVACRGDVLNVLYQVVLPLADLALVHITRRPCWAGCWHRGGANGGVGHGRPRALGERGRAGTSDAV